MGNVLSRFGALLLLISVAVNVMQAQRIKNLVSSEPQQAVLGSRAAPIVGRTLDGEMAEVAFDANLPTVLYYFSPSCVWCERNWANIQELASAASGRYRVVGLTSQQNIKGFSEDRGLRIELVEGISSDSVARYGLSGTPHTLLVDGEGIVTHSWRGAFTPRIQRQLEELFGVSLPGLVQPPAVAGRQAR